MSRSSRLFTNIVLVAVMLTASVRAINIQISSSGEHFIGLFANGERNEATLTDCSADQASVIMSLFPTATSMVAQASSALTNVQNEIAAGTGTDSVSRTYRQLFSRNVLKDNLGE